jgi:sterol desaturase/sphingolipid hydroxylase (fatty acid hydroxylase superfamily)
VVALAGVPPPVVILFEIVLNAGSMFTHANWFVPPAVDRLLRLVVVTPDMHRVHHSTEPGEQGTNYGFNLSWWDRLFGTYVDQPRRGHDAMTIGVAGVAPPSSLGGLLALPWRGERSVSRTL